MTRKLLAFLALLSGLAALSGASTASFAHNSTQCNASVSATAEAASASQRSTAKRAPGKSSVRTGDTGSKPSTPAPRSLRLPVLMGVERAYE